MGKAEEYFWRAHEADQQAKAALSSSARAQFERIANNWRNLARQTEALDRKDRERGLSEPDPG